MAEQSFPFENIDTTESQFSEWATNFQETGVQGSPTGTELGITVTGSDLNLTIAAGQAFIRGHYYINTDNLVLAVTSASVNTRIDIVVVELDPEANTIVTKIVSGEAVSADPVAPTLTQSATGIYQLPIATLTIPASTVAITTGMLVDTRTFMGNRVGIWTTATRPTDPTNYQTIGYNTTIESHESWNGTAWVGFFDPITTAGDLVVGDATGQASRLGVGADDQVLSVVAGEVAWADGGGGGNYYNITAAGTYTVDLAAGLYNVATTRPVTVAGEVLEGLALKNYASGISSLGLSDNFTVDWLVGNSGIGYTYAAAYGEGLYVIAGNDGDMATSPDTITWTNRTSGFGSNAVRALTYADGLFVAVGDTGNMTTSTDGISWTTRDPILTGRIYSVTYGDGLYLAASRGKITTSTDGTTWTQQNSGPDGNIFSLAYGDGLYLAAGANGELETSPNGTTWTPRTTGFLSYIDITALAYGDGLYVAGGEDGDLRTSTDGITWTSRTSGFDSTEISGLTYADGVYVAVGSSGKLSTSTDGTTWTPRTTGTGSSLYGVTYGDGVCLAVGSSGRIVSSQFTPCFLSLELKTPVTTLS